MSEFENQLPETSESGMQPNGGRRPGWMDAIRDAADDPDWPPLPTMASDGGLPPTGGSGAEERSGRPLRIRPRGVGNGGMANVTGSIKPVTEALNQQALVHFHCPSCLAEMKVSQADLNLDYSCPSCLALIAPPRVVRR